MQKAEDEKASLIDQRRIASLSAVIGEKERTLVMSNSEGREREKKALLL